MPGSERGRLSLPLWPCRFEGLSSNHRSFVPAGRMLFSSDSMREATRPIYADEDELRCVVVEVDE